MITTHFSICFFLPATTFPKHCTREYFVLHGAESADQSQAINLLQEVVKAAFSTKSSSTSLPKLKRELQVSNPMIGGEIIACLKWLTYTAPFQDFNAALTDSLQVIQGLVVHDSRFREEDVQGAEGAVGYLVCQASAEQEARRDQVQRWCSQRFRCRSRCQHHRVTVYHCSASDSNDADANGGADADGGICILGRL
jgi:hypothetical protein